MHRLILENMKETVNIKRKIRSKYILVLCIIVPVLLFVHIETLLSYGKFHEYYNTYYRNTEKITYKILKKAETGISIRISREYSFYLENVKTGEKVIKDCNEKEYAFYDPGQKITYNLSKKELGYNIPSKPCSWFLISIFGGLVILCCVTIPILCNTKVDNAYEYNVAIAMCIYNVVVILSAIVEYIVA